MSAASNLIKDFIYVHVRVPIKFTKYSIAFVLNEIWLLRSTIYVPFFLSPSLSLSPSTKNTPRSGGTFLCTLVLWHYRQCCNCWFSFIYLKSFQLKKCGAISTNLDITTTMTTNDQQRQQ